MRLSLVFIHLLLFSIVFCRYLSLCPNVMLVLRLLLVVCTCLLLFFVVLFLLFLGDLLSWRISQYLSSIVSLHLVRERMYAEKKESVHCTGSGCVG